MPTKRVGRLRAKTGTYTDRQTGNEKTSYMTCGSILERDGGELMFKVDALPVSFDGWFYWGELETQQGQQQPQGRPQSKPQDFEDFNDDIPF